MTDSLARVLAAAENRFGIDGGTFGKEYFECLARAACDYFVSQIEDEIEDVERYGDGGMQPTSAGLKRAIGIINRSAK